MLHLGRFETPEFPAPLTGADWITPTLAVGGMLYPRALKRAFARAHVGAIVDMRSEDQDDVLLLQRHGIAFLHLPTSDHQAVTQEMLDAGVEFLRRHLAHTRVLVHCQFGIGRSACLSLCALADAGHKPIDALRLMKARRPLISPSPPQYEAWSEWLRRHAIAPPSFDEFCAVAYSHLKP